MIGVPESPQIDTPRPAYFDDLQSVFRVGGDQESLPEVAAGSVGNEPELDIGIP